MPISTLLRVQVFPQEPARISPQLNPRKFPYFQPPPAQNCPAPPAIQSAAVFLTKHPHSNARESPPLKESSMKSTLAIIVVLVSLLCSGIQAQDSKNGFQFAQPQITIGGVKELRPLVREIAESLHAPLPQWTIIILTESQWGTWTRTINVRDALASVHLTDAILDGEIVCLDQDGRSQFLELMRRKRQDAYFYAFDLLWLNGEDLRPLPLLDRKQRLQKLLKGHAGALYAEHVQAKGKALFEAICTKDLEGIVAKHKDGPYTPAPMSWFKCLNPNYSQHPKLFPTPGPT